MPLQYKHLDQNIRNFMLKEIELDISSARLYLSENLSEAGKAQYPDLLRKAATEGDDSTLAIEIKPRLNSHEKPRKLKDGGFSKPPAMRVNAHEMLAEGEFNRFYIRAVCLQALSDGQTRVEVYRAKEVQNPRQESKEKIGEQIPAKELLNDLRENTRLDTVLKLPPGPNSGLSVCLIST